VIMKSIAFAKNSASVNALCHVTNGYNRSAADRTITVFTKNYSSSIFSSPFARVLCYKPTQLVLYNLIKLKSV